MAGFRGAVAPVMVTSAMNLPVAASALLSRKAVPWKRSTRKLVGPVVPFVPLVPLTPLAMVMFVPSLQVMVRPPSPLSLTVQVVAPGRAAIVPSVQVT